MYKLNIHNFDYLRLCIILLNLFILLQALPVHFFAENAEYLYLARYYSQHPLKIFFVVPFVLENRGYIHHLFFYRPMERIFFTFNYIIGKLNPLPYNITQGLLFLILVVSIYNIVHLISNNRLSAVLSVTFFLLIPTNYKIIHWLGNSDILSSPLMWISLFFLFIALKNNNSKLLFIGLFFTLLALLTKTSTAIVLPINFFLFYIFYKREYRLNKKMFYIGLVYILCLAILHLILHGIAYKNVKTYHYSIHLLYRIGFNNIFKNIVVYYKIFYNNCFPLLFLIAFILALFRRKKDYFLFLSWAFIAIIVYLPIYNYSSKYFNGMTVGLSMFLGAVLADYIIKSKGCKWIGVIFICLGLIFSIPRIKNNIKMIRHTYELANKSYLLQKENFKRFQYLPKDAIIYVDDDIVRYYYLWYLALMDREDVKIEVVSSKDTVKPEFFFEGETKIIQEPFFMIIDKLGDWRF
ncbi:MAG: glycosyltransferase family 39 protein [Candidatus Omnitrophica bacterium]|nr:glycosyltransferase family 39 protein [Candidatus Omnitrophota bacterium]